MPHGLGADAPAVPNANLAQCCLMRPLPPLVCSPPVFVYLLPPRLKSLLVHPFFVDTQSQLNTVISRTIGASKLRHTSKRFLG